MKTYSVILTFQAKCDRDAWRKCGKLTKFFGILAHGRVTVSGPALHRPMAPKSDG